MTKKREDDRMNTNKSTKHKIHKNKSEKNLVLSVDDLMEWKGDHRFQLLYN